MPRIPLDESVVVTMTRAQMMLLIDVAYVADEVLSLSGPLDGGHRLRSWRTAVDKLTKAAGYRSPYRRPTT